MGVKNKTFYCQDDIFLCVRCKEQCTNCSSGYNQFYNLKEESKHEEDE